MNFTFLKFACVMMLLSSCIVQSPKYCTLNQVLNLKVGMTKIQVEEQLGLKPYNIKTFNEASHTFIYVYRLTDRKTLSFYTKALNGKEAIGKYVQLAVTYSNNNQLLSVESCTSCPDNLVTTSKLDFEKISVFVTITLPVLLIYFGFKK